MPRLTKNDNYHHPFIKLSPNDHRDKEKCSVFCPSSKGREKRVGGMQEHGYHHDVHAVPVRVPTIRTQGFVRKQQIGKNELM